MGFRCVLHSASSSIKWALSSFSSQQLLDDLHLSTKSCSNSSHALHGCVPSFVLQHIGYRDSEHSPEERTIWWSALGIPAVLIVWVLRVDPRWDRVALKLWVCSAVQDSSEGVDLVHDVLLLMLRWRDFSDTRWAGVGPSTRRLILSLAVGLEAMVQQVDRDGKGNDRYYLSAAKTRLGSETNKLAAIASLSSYPLESLSLELLQDDRWLLVWASLWAEAESEADWVSGLPDSVFSSLADIVGDPMWSGTEARNDIIKAVRTSMAYMHKEALAPLHELPFSATQGDVRKRVDEIAAMPQPPAGT